MSYQIHIYTFICLYLCSIFLVISADQECDKSTCKGPLAYYEDIGCTPTYSAQDNCCPIKYNCDHLKGRSEDKCYYKGHVYAIRERLREEDAKPCDIGCFCSPGYRNGPARFRCAAVHCPRRAQPGCYLKKTHDRCCPGPEVCPQNGTAIAQCEVDGKTYFDGQLFTPNSDPSVYCICAEGYTGENVSPFCKPRETSCKVELRHAAEIYKNCTPAFYSSQNPATDCNHFFQCQNENDRVVVPTNAPTTELTPVADPGSTCTLGQLTMNIGDQINPETDHSSVRLKCVCEVPPLATCQQLT